MLPLRSLFQFHLRFSSLGTPIIREVQFKGNVSIMINEKYYFIVKIFKLVSEAVSILKLLNGLFNRSFMNWHFGLIIEKEPKRQSILGIYFNFIFLSVVSRLVVYLVQLLNILLYFVSFFGLYIRFTDIALWIRRKRRQVELNRFH